MRLHVSLICAVLVANARAATIHAPVATDLQKKLINVPEELNAESVIPLDNKPVETESIDAANPVKNVENDLRTQAVDSIPVSVIVEGDVSNPVENEVNPDVKRVKLDLEHPGIPQRQEHETQNAVHYDDKPSMVSTVEQSVVDTQIALKQGFQGVAQGIQNWIANNEQLSAIQASLNNLQENFVGQINKLNETLHTFWNNRIGPNPPTVETQSNPQIESVESHLKNLENDIKVGVKALSEGVQVYASLKAENENVKPPTTPGQSPPPNLFVQYLQLLQNTVTQGFNNVTQTIQSFITQGANNGGQPGGLLQNFNNGLQNILQGSQTPTAAQGDVSGVTARPTIWQGIQSSIQTILNPGAQGTQPAQGASNQGSATPNQGSQDAQNQAAQDAQNTNPAAVPNRPILQAIQNLPFVQGVVGLIQPNRPAAAVQPVQPASPAQPAAAQPVSAPIQPGSNVVPVPENPSTEVKEPQKEAETPQAAAPQQPAADGPIKNIIQNNPIVMGISNAVQRLQASVNNPEKPRDDVPEPIKEEIPQPAKVEVPKPAEEGSEKGHYGFGGYGGYGGHGGNNNAGDINNSGGVIKSAPVKAEDTKVEDKPSVETDKTDKS